MEVGIADIAAAESCAFSREGESFSAENLCAINVAVRTKGSPPFYRRIFRISYPEPERQGIPRITSASCTKYAAIW